MFDDRFLLLNVNINNIMKKKRGCHTIRLLQICYNTTSRYFNKFFFIILDDCSQYELRIILLRTEVKWELYCNWHFLTGIWKLQFLPFLNYMLKWNINGWYNILKISNFVWWKNEYPKMDSMTMTCSGYKLQYWWKDKTLYRHFYYRRFRIF